VDGESSDYGSTKSRPWRMPLSNPFVERLVGTMRREFLDHVLFWNAGDLERKLTDFQAYDNAARGHGSLEGHTPLTFACGHTVARAELNKVRWVSHCRDLVQLQWRPDDESEPTGFHRAFRRWHGTTPGAFCRTRRRVTACSASRRSPCR
jgi:hypothetical protein